jgi:hypothetical protein
MKYFLVYYAIGLVWIAFNFASAPELMLKVLQKGWEDAGVKWWGRTALAMVLLIVVIAWPWNMALFFLPDVGVSKRYLDTIRRFVRKQVLDRPGLLEPQMPAPRCLVHDLALDIEEARCSLCNGQLRFLFCVACRTQMNAQGYVLPPAGIVCHECEETYGQ